MVKPLVLHLKREYWQAIKNGQKIEEYRERGPYWGKRLRNREYSEIQLLLGYPRRGDTTKTLRRKWNGYKERTLIDHPLWGKGCVPVFVIDVSQEV